MKSGTINNGRDEKGRCKLTDVVPLKVPFNIQIEPSEICNFRCEYCVHSVNRLNNNEMKWEVFEKILEDLKGLTDNIKIINLIGYGEPLVYKDISKMVAQIAKAQITDRIEITTNASLLTPSKSEELVKSGLTRLIVSLQGLSAEKYKKICGYNINFNEFLNNLKYFYTNRGKCRLHLKIADTALDEGDEQKFYEMFGNICDDLYIEHIIPVYKEVDYNGKLKATADITRYGYKYKEALVCPQPFYQMFIKANGDVAPCCMYPSPMVIGNVREQTLKDIWNGQKLRDFQVLQLLKKRSCNAVCRDCVNPEEAMCPLDNMDDDAERVLKRITNN